MNTARRKRVGSLPERPFRRRARGLPITTTQLSLLHRPLTVTIHFRPAAIPLSSIDFFAWLYFRSTIIGGERERER